MIGRFSEMTPDGLQALQPGVTVFLFPIGGLEQHGPHLPLGVKVLQAEVYARTLAEELQKRLPLWNYVLMPVIPLTVDGITNHQVFPVRAHVVRDAVVDQCEHLKRLGFTRFLAVNSHLSPKQITALEDAARIVSGRSWWIGKKSQLVSVTGALVDAKTVFESPLIALPPEHGGEKDASFMLAYALTRFQSIFWPYPRFHARKPRWAGFFAIYPMKSMAIGGRLRARMPTMREWI